MATYEKYDSYVLAFVNGVHDWDANTFRIALTNTAPNKATHVGKADITELTTTGGYTVGGNQTTISTTSSGTNPATAKVTGTDPTAWTGSGAGFTFSHAVLYNDTPTTPVADPLVSYWAYGSSQLVGLGETLTVDLDGTNGIFTVT